VIVAGSMSAVAIFTVSVLMDSITRFTNQQTHYAAQAEAKRNNIKHVLTSWFPAASIQESPQNGDSKPPLNDPTAHPQQQPIGHEDSVGANGQTHPVNETGPPSGTAEDPQQEVGKEASPKVAEDLAETGPMDWLYDQVNPSAMLSFAVQVAGSLSSLLSQLLLISLMVVFILLEVGTFEHKLKRAFSSSKQTTEQGAQMVHSVQRYVAIKTVLSLGTAILVGVWLKLFATKYIALWMLLTFLLNFIPNVGSIAAAIPAVLITWLDTEVTPVASESANAVLIRELLPALGVAAGYVVINVSIGNFLEPRLMGKTLGLSPLIIFCSMIFWGWVLGPIGMLLSVPLPMTVHIVLNGFDDTRWIATLMGAGTKET
jgi:predicted PurR-regulated permease PerM